MCQVLDRPLEDDHRHQPMGLFWLQSLPQQSTPHCQTNIPKTGLTLLLKSIHGSQLPSGQIQTSTQIPVMQTPFQPQLSPLHTPHFVYSFRTILDLSVIPQYNIVFNTSMAFPLFWGSLALLSSDKPTSPAPQGLRNIRILSYFL